MQAAELFDLSGQVALVTGASSGLGWRFAELLAANGAKLALAARRTDRLEELKKKIEASGGVATTVALDVSQHLQIAAAFDHIEEALGTPTIVVNNAGIAEPKMALEMTPADWRQIMQVNLDGVWFIAQEAAKRMVAQGVGGSIINIASLLALRVASGLSAYAVSKAGVKQLTEALALEWARYNIRVNAIAPGYILTDMNREFFSSEAGERFIKTIPQRRIGEPCELDGTVLLLASGASSFITGTTIKVDGGHALAMPA